MQEISTEVNADSLPPLSWSAAAKELGMTYSGFTRLLRSHTDIKSRYCYKIHVDGRFKSVITLHGIKLLVARKDSRRNGKRELDSTFQSTPEMQIKTQMAAKSIAMEEMMNDPVIALRLEQLQMKQDIVELKALVAAKQESPLLLEATQKLESFLEPTATESLTHSQRSFIKERVNALVFKKFGENIPDNAFSSTRKAMNDAVGRRTIDDYNMDDYAVAIKWLKKEYARFGLPW